MTGEVNISVALCTCNGEKFLDEQLISLAQQNYAPGELVVCDDASIDGTWKLLENFKKGAQFPVRLYRNESRLGAAKNFEQAIHLCTGDVIALCDQDDVWLPEKLRRYVECFVDGIDSIACDARVTDAALMPLGYTLWNRVVFNARQRHMARDGRLMEVMLKHSTIAGATLAFRTKLRDQLLPIPSNWLYDAWLAAMLAASANVFIIDECLQLYRQHENNVIGGKRQAFVAQLRKALVVVRTDYLSLESHRWQQLSERLDDIQAPKSSANHVKEKLDHLMRRSQFPDNRLARIPYVFGEVVRGGYSRYSRNWGSVALDFLLR